MTMNATAPAAAPAPATAPGTQSAPLTPPITIARSTVGDRIAALKIGLDESGGDGEIAEGEVTADPAKPAAAEVAVDPNDPIAKTRADRMARIEAVRAKEREDDVKRQQKNQNKTSIAEVEELRAKLAKLEPLNDVFGSEEALLSAAEARGLDASKLVQWMRTRLSDPAAVASRQAKTEVDKVREELAAERKAREQLEASLKQRDEDAREQYSAQQKASGFIEQAGAKKDSHPLTAALLGKHGPRGLIAYANQFVAPLLPEGYSLEQLHDHIEQLLDETQVGGASPAPALPANGQSLPSKKNGAAEPVTTLSNSVASARTTIEEEVPLHRLPKSERLTRVREKLGRS